MPPACNADVVCPATRFTADVSIIPRVTLNVSAAPGVGALDGVLLPATGATAVVVLELGDVVGDVDVGEDVSVPVVVPVVVLDDDEGLVVADVELDNEALVVLDVVALGVFVLVAVDLVVDVAVAVGLAAAVFVAVDFVVDVVFVAVVFFAVVLVAVVFFAVVFFAVVFLAAAFFVVFFFVAAATTAGPWALDTAGAIVTESAEIGAADADTPALHAITTPAAKLTAHVVFFGNVLTCTPQANRVDGRAVAWWTRRACLHQADTPILPPPTRAALDPPPTATPNGGRSEYETHSAWCEGSVAATSLRPTARVRRAAPNSHMP